MRVSYWFLFVVLGVPSAGCGDDAAAMDGGVDASSDAPVDAQADGSQQDAGPVADGGGARDAGPSRCDDIPSVPVTYTVKDGPLAVEDFAFDSEGRMIGHDGEGNLVRSTFDGQTRVFVPNASFHISGIAILPGGDVLYADSEQGALYRVVASGSRRALLSGIAYPNGIAVGPDGFIYVAEQSAGQVRRVHPDTGAFTVVARGIYEPNGVAFDAGRTLYIGSFGAGRVYRITIAADGTASPVEEFAAVPDAPELDRDGNPILPGGEEPPDDDSPPGEAGGLDGIAVDACGYVYATEFVKGVVWRISPDGSRVEKLIDPPTEWVPNMHWGNGVGGWDPHTLYVIDAIPSRMYVVPLGIGSAR